jgi:murein DD-endopeptidase MepM/ murein hydrolase activator NlpD
MALEGDLVQGGLIVGRVAPGSFIFADGRQMRVSADGVFIFGIGRDAASGIELRVGGPDGAETVRTIAVAARNYEIQRIDGLPARQVNPSEDDLARIGADAALIADVRKRDSPGTHFLSGFVWPVTGTVSGVFGSQRILNGEPRRPHNGVDVAAPEGTPVVAAADGIVALRHADMYFTGKTVMIDHGHGLSSVYVHMSVIAVADGQRVAKGETIGQVGATGRVTGPHLHWGVSHFATPIDPALLVPAMEQAQGKR